MDYLTEYRKAMCKSLSTHVLAQLDERMTVRLDTLEDFRENMPEVAHEQWWVGDMVNTQHMIGVIDAEFAARDRAWA